MNKHPDILSKRRQLLAASALVPIVGALSRPATLQALIYTVFVCIYLTPFVIKAAREKNLEEQSPDLPLPTGASLAESAAAQIKELKEKQRLATINFVLVIVGAGLISECLAWVSELFAQVPNPALLHPQLFPDLFLALFVYLGLALAWLILLSRFQFALKEIFLVCFFVALLDQARVGALPVICEKLVSDPVTALMALASLFVVLGSVAALGFLAGGKIAETEKKPALVQLMAKYALSFVLIVFITYLTGFGGGLIARPLGLYPDKKPIWDAPLI